MGKHMKVLAQLQEIDLKIDFSRGETLSLQAEIHALEARLEEMRQAIAAQSSELEAIETEKRVLEENLATETETISRSESRQREIKTQKEYQAVSKEIAAAKKVKGELEEQILQKITSGDELKEKIAKSEDVLRDFEAHAETEKEKLQAKIGQLETVISADNAARETAAKNVAASMMKRYDMLREKRQGLAIVEARNGSCLGCNMNLPPQVFNSLFKDENLVSCPHCQRILFLRQEEAEPGV